MGFSHWKLHCHGLSAKRKADHKAVSRSWPGILFMTWRDLIGYTIANKIYLRIYIYIYDPGPRSRSPPPPPPQWYGPPLAVPQTSRLHAVCRLSPQLRAICCVWVMSSLVCGLFASMWDLRFLICRLLEASMHFCLYYVLIPRHVYCHHHSCLASVLLMCCWHLI